jgi:NAD dependent epimerase/dehydratase family enzyme
MRAALVLSPGRGGIFDTLLGLVRRGLGGRSYDGRQYISWLHEQDFIRSVSWLIEREELSGAINLAAPNPLPNAEFMRILRKAYGVSFGLPAAKWMLKLGALLMQSETELILKSRRVVPSRLLKSGFKFDFPDWGDAARDLCQKWREMK